MRKAEERVSFADRSDARGRAMSDSLQFANKAGGDDNKTNGASPVQRNLGEVVEESDDKEKSIRQMDVLLSQAIDSPLRPEDNGAHDSSAGAVKRVL